MTEPRYIHALAVHCRNPSVVIRIDRHGGVPRVLVQRAIRAKLDAEGKARRYGDSNLKYDEVWVVCDVDEHPHVAEAIRQARDNGVFLALSNPCFEFWALLHFQDQRGSLTVAKAKAALRRHLPGYRKALDFDAMARRVDLAIERATALERHAASTGALGRNPSTGMHHLVRRIVEEGSGRG